MWPVVFEVPAPVVELTLGGISDVWNSVTCEFRVLAVLSAW